LAASGYQTLKKMRSGKSLSHWDSRRVDVRRTSAALS